MNSQLDSQLITHRRPYRSLLAAFLLLWGCSGFAWLWALFLESRLHHRPVLPHLVDQAPEKVILLFCLDKNEVFQDI